MKLFTKDIDKKLFAQFFKGGELANQKVIAKIFNPYGRGVWYIINSDPNDPDYLWAIVNLFEVEVGSVSRKELESLRIKPFMLPLERDLSFRERNALEVYEGASQGQRFEDGGEMDDDEGVDLFEDYEDQPEEVSELLSTLEVEDYNYDSLNDLLAEMKKIGYTFEFGLDAEPYDLRKIGQKGKSEYYAEGGELGTINTELINVKNNIMGTTTLQMKIKGMRKPQDFIVYPISADQSNKPIMIQSDTRFGFLDLSTGEGLMSQSHANGAYSYHYQSDKKVHFKLSETDVQRIKSDLSKKASSKVGNSVVFSDNSGANMMAEGGITYKQIESLADEIDLDYIYSKRFKGAKNKVGDVATGLVIFDDGKNNFGEFVYEDKNGKEYQSKEIPSIIVDFSKVPYYGKMAEGGETEKRKMILLESKSLSTPRKRVLTSQDYEKMYIYDDGVLYDTDYMLNKTTSYRMSKIDLTILPLEYNQGKMAEGGKLDESTKMVLSQNKAIAHHTEELKRALKKDPNNVEPWVIGKVGRAETDISDVTHYLDGRSEYAEGGKLGDSNYLCQMAEEYAERKFEKPVKKGQCVAKATKNGNLYKYTEVTVYFKDGTNHLFKEEDFEEFFDIDEFARGGKTPLMLKYVSPRDISILKITTDDGIKHLIKGESIISGEYKLAKGGKLSDNYVYIPKRNIDKVILKNGETTDDKFNGFYVKKESLKSVESYSSEENDGVAKMKNAIAKVKSDKTSKSKEIANIFELANTFAFQDAVEKSIKENKKSEAIDVYAEAINTLSKSNKAIISKNLAEYGNPNAINLFPAKYIDVPSLKLKSIAKKYNIENDENWLKQINKFAMSDSDSSYYLRPALTSVRFENNSVVATDANILIHIYNETEVEAKEICVSNVCKKIGGDKTSENATQSKYPQWTYIIINSFDRLDSCEININDFLKLAEFSVNQYTNYFNEIAFVAVKTKHRTIFFNSEFIVKTMTTLKLLGLTKCKMHYDSEKKNNAIYFTSVEATYNPLKNDFVLVMPILSHDDQQFGIDGETGKYIIAKNEYKKGGMTFNEKVESVQLSLLEREVPKKYRNSYGKTYNKEEAHESAQKIIGAQLKKYNKK